MAASPAQAHLRLVSAHPAATPTTVDQPAERELRIEIYLDDWARFEGTAAQLIAEGLIPKGFEWPLAATDKEWEANGLKYRVRRTRPEGHKGPMRSWLELDNWFVRISVVGRDYHWHTRRRLERKAQALAAEVYHHTPAGSREWSAKWNRYMEANRDKAFQAFKTLIPGLVPPKRGRKPKSEATQGAQQ